MRICIYFIFRKCCCKNLFLSNFTEKVERDVIEDNVLKTK